MRASAGFTLVELVVVLVLAGVLATVAGPRFFGGGTFDERSYYDEVAGSLRYAQKLAVASGCPVRVSLSAAGYTVGQQAPLGGHCNTADTSFATPVMLPDGQALGGTPPPGVAVAPALTVVFDAAGSTSLASDRTISVGSRAITVLAASGLVLAP